MLWHVEAYLLIALIGDVMNEGNYSLDKGRLWLMIEK